MRIIPPLPSIVAALLLLVGVSCSTDPEKKAAYHAFLNKIAEDCKPLIIGSDNMGLALQFNGVGADPENYNNFLGKTSALYYGSIPPEVYRNSLTAFMGAGTSNNRSFDCIIAHVPKS